MVESRAGHVCEYCLIHANDVFVGCQVDHIISEKHGGPTVSVNLAFACSYCNRQKGSDVGSIDKVTGQFIRLLIREPMCGANISGWWEFASCGGRPWVRPRCVCSS